MQHKPQHSTAVLSHALPMTKQGHARMKNLTTDIHIDCLGCENTCSAQAITACPQLGRERKKEQHESKLQSWHASPASKSSCTFKALASQCSTCSVGKVGHLDRAAGKRLHWTSIYMPNCHQRRVFSTYDSPCRAWPLPLMPRT